MCIRDRVKAVFSYVIYINIANTVSNTAPGIPNIPTTSAVTTFIPICNPHTVPTMLITYNNTAPKNEFIINLVIIFIGIINIFPTMFLISSVSWEEKAEWQKQT